MTLPKSHQPPTPGAVVFMRSVVSGFSLRNIMLWFFALSSAPVIPFRPPRLRAEQFVPGNKEHITILKTMGITVVQTKDGRIQLMQTASSVRVIPSGVLRTIGVELFVFLSLANIHRYMTGVHNSSSSTSEVRKAYLKIASCSSRGRQFLHVTLFHSLYHTSGPSCLKHG